MSGTGSPHDDALIDELFNGVQAVGLPTMPPGRRTEVVSLLSRVMTNPKLFNVYTAALADRRESLGLTARMMALPGPNIPDQEILQNGFAGLPDEVLADLALSPEALEALEDVFYSEEPDGRFGKWFFSVGEQADVAGVGGSTSPAPPTPRGTFASSRPRTALALALAASVLLGVGLGWWVRGPGETLHASAGPMRLGDARGPTGEKPREFTVSNAGSRRVFVSLVGLSPNGPPRVFDKDDRKYLAVEPGGSRVVKNFEAELAGATVYLAVVTETPAGDVVRDLLPREPTTGVMALKGSLEVSLRGLGYRSPQVDVLTPP